MNDFLASAPSALPLASSLIGRAAPPPGPPMSYPSRTAAALARVHAAWADAVASNAALADAHLTSLTHFLGTTHDVDADLSAALNTSAPSPQRTPGAPQ